MLSKLIRYEFRSTYQIFLGVYGVMLVLCTVTGTLDRVDRLFNGKLPLLGVFLGLSIMFLFAAIVITTVLNLNRFYKGLFKDEGYLIHTLPVSSWQILAAKLIPATLWTIGTTVMMVLSMGLMALASVVVSGEEVLRYFQAMGEMICSMSGEAVLTLLLCCLMTLTALVCFILQIYASITLGQQVPKHPVGAAVLTWFGINLVQTWSFNLIWTPILNGLTTQSVYVNTAVELLFSPSASGGIWWNILFYALWSALFWAVTQVLLSRRLNLS